MRYFQHRAGLCLKWATDAFREVIHRNYRIVYMHLSADDRVEVLTVFHASWQFGAPPSE
ncbi:MAG: type II toxin-antitoxin system RelE/ParE family toxin [Bacteroidota bacterium]